MIPQEFQVVPEYVVEVRMVRSAKAHLLKEGRRACSWTAVSAMWIDQPEEKKLQVAHPESLIIIDTMQFRGDSKRVPSASIGKSEAIHQA